MWRKLSEEEKRNLLANYQLGAYIVRFLMGGWLLFVTIGYVSGLRNVMVAMGQGDWFSVFVGVVGGVIGAVLFYGIPVWVIRNIGTQEIQALKNDEVYLGAALFVSGTYSFRSRRMGQSIRYLAKVKLLDEWGNTRGMVECRSIGNLRTTCREGDRITVLRLAKPDGDELVAMKKKLI